MNSTEISKQKMYNAVDVTLIRFIDTLKPLPNYSPSYQKFRNALDVINSASEKQMLMKSTGLTMKKKQFKKDLWVLVLDSSKKLHAFAKFTNNLVLLNEISFSASTIKYSNEEELREYAQVVYKRGNEYLPELEPYGITTETQGVLLAAITSYEEAMPQGRISKVLGKHETLRLKQAFKDADAALDDIDSLIEIIHLKEPDCYNQYHSIRKIINLAKSPISLKCLVIEAGTKELLKNATVTFTLKSNGSTPAPNGKGSVVKKSAQKGGFYIKTLSEGIYIVTIQKTGYVDKQLEIVVSKGTLYKLVVELQKI